MRFVVSGEFPLFRRHLRHAFGFGERRPARREKCRRLVAQSASEQLALDLSSEYFRGQRRHGIAEHPLDFIPTAIELQVIWERLKAAQLASR
jgi:hypothetical protein